MVSPQFRLLALTNQEQERFGRIRTRAQIRRLDGQEFERFVGYLYTQDGFTVLDGPAGADGGIDLVLQRPGSETIVQCKRNTSSAVGERVVRDLLGTAFYNNADEAILVAAGQVSQPARNFAATSPRPLTIIDGATLVAFANRVNPLHAYTPPPQPSRLGRLLKQLSVLLQDERYFTPIIVVLLCLALLLAISNMVLAQDNQDPDGDRGQGGMAETTTPIAQQETPTPLPPPTSTPPPPDPRNLVSPYLRPPVDINGDLSEWNGLPAVQSMYRVYTGTLDESHLDTMSATWRAGWDETYLYVGAEVFDDVHVQNRSGRNMFLGDCVEFQLDADRADDGTVVNGDDYIIMLSPGDFDDMRPSAYLVQGGGDGRFSADTPLTIAIASRPTVNGYTLEAAINWSLLGITPRPGLVLGIALNSSDNDTVGAALQEALYSHVPDREYLVPATWGTVSLTD